MPDPHRIARELEAILSKPQYAALLARRAQFRNPLDRNGKPSVADTAASIAQGTANHLWKNHPLLDPVEVLELRGPLELYRTHDGGASATFQRNDAGKMQKTSSSAGTLGGSWVERSVVETIWKATAKYSAADRPKWFMEFMRTANFVLPEWNSMLYVVCMTVPAGTTLPVVRGRGDWKAMKTPPANPARPQFDNPRIKAGTTIHTPADVENRLGMVPIPGLMQCVVQLLNDMWIQPVDPKSAKWPLYT